MARLYETLTAIGAEQLYFPDGSINFELIETCVQDDLAANENRSSTRPSPLADFSTQIHSFDITQPANSPTIEETPEEKRVADPIQFAIEAYIGKLFASAIEIDIPISAIHPELKDNPLFELQLSAELERYFKFLKDKQAVRNENLIDLYNRLTPAGTDAKKLKCVVAIPAAGHQEYTNIFTTLEQFTKQDMESFEVFLYLNLPAEEGQRDEELAVESRKTQAEIERFKQCYPLCPVRTVNATYRHEKPPIGKIRSDLWDLIGFDLKQRGRQDDILVISADADIINLNKTYLSGMYETWQKTGADFVTANLLWQSVPDLPYDSTVNRLLRYQAFVDMVRDNYGTRLLAADANTGISLATYLAVGGYDRNAVLGEMYGLVSRIRYVRNQKDDPSIYRPLKVTEAKSNTSYLKTHSRRLVKAMALGRAPYEAWDQKLIVFGNNDSLRIESMAAELAEENAQRYWKKWLRRDTPPYTRDVPPATKRRLLKTARQILGFADLYR